MSSDYFLIHRGLQIQRLCSQDRENHLEIPGRFARDGLPANIVAFLRQLDRIRKLPLDEKSEQGMKQLLRGLRTSRPRELTPRQRDLIYSFETQLVELSLSDDAPAARLAKKFVEAILADRGYFFGLKPLAQHTDDFAYEFLYPTWLNLFTAVRQISDGQVKFSDAQASEMWNFLRDYAGDDRQTQQPLVGLLTFAANRMPPDEALGLVRRLQRLCKIEPTSAATHAHRIFMLQDQSPSAGVLRELLIAYLHVECQLKGEAERRNENSTRGTFPPSLVGKLRELQQSPDEFDTYRQVLVSLGKIMARAGGIDQSFGQLFATGEYDVTELLDLCLSAEPGRPAFSCQAQQLVARIMQLDEADSRRKLRHVRPFAHHLARRIDTLDPLELRVFTAEFIENPKNRGVLLASAANADMRQRIAGKLIEAARTERDNDRFFQRIQSAAIIGPSPDQPGLEKIRQSIAVIQLSRRDESISRGELETLVNDLRENLPASLGYLESPGFAGRGKADRLAKMYLTLNEACHLFTATGKVGNFGLVRAAYRNLDGLIDDQDDGMAAT